MTKVLLRLLVREPELANSIADLAGIDARGAGVQTIARRTIEQLAGSQHEYRDVQDADQEAAESRLSDVLNVAAERLSQPEERARYDLALGRGTKDVEAYLRESEPARDSSRWGTDPSYAYFDALLRLAALNITVWALADPPSRERATLALARGSMREIEHLSERMHAAIGQMSDLQRGLEEMMARIDSTGRGQGFVVLYDPEDELHMQRATWIEQVLIAARTPVRRVPMPSDIDGGAAWFGQHRTFVVPWREDLGAAPERGLFVRFEEISTDSDPSVIVVPRSGTAHALVAELAARFPHAPMAHQGLDSARVIYADERLPRLRIVSEQAVSAAESIGDRSFREGLDTTSPLFVLRDLHTRVLAAAAPGRVIVVQGEAGDGKTSLLWGVARDMAEAAASHDVYFVPAGHLVPVGDQPALVPADELIEAVRHQRVHGDNPTVLIDTADLLVNDATSLSTLRTVLEDLGRAGGCVILSSRPGEAQRIATDTTQVLSLGRYATATTAEMTSEFVRAVAGHAITYCGSPGDTVAMSEQLTQAVMRENSLGEVARKPLFLRMLFELYSPGVVPLDVEPTVLFERFWQNRVVEDRRSWEDGAVATGGDLSRTAKSLAMEMLRVGRPEVDVRDVPVATCERNSLAREISYLLSRGVGRKTSANTFEFFHQAFFEYAAAMALLDTLGGLEAAVQHAATHPDDLFVAAVVEQAWMSALRRSDKSDDAERLAVETLRDNTLPDMLVRVAARVAAGNRLSPLGQVAIIDFLAHADLSLVKEYLRRRPRPGRSWEEAEGHWVRVLRNRPHKFWTAGMEPLARAFRADPQLTVAGLVEALGTTSVEFPGAADLATPEVRTFICMVGAQYPELVLQWLESARRAGTSTSLEPSAIVGLLRNLPTQVAQSAAELADRWLGSVSGTAGEKYAELHLRWLGLVDDDDRRDALIGRASRCLDDMRAADAASIHSAAAYVRGLCLALDEWSDPNRDEQVLDLLLRQTSPRIHEQVHDGWLAPMANRSDAVRARLAQVLTGLPASKASPENDAARWADTVRRLLSHRLLRSEGRVAILEHLAHLSDGMAISRGSWLDPSTLLPALISAAAAGVDSAWDAFNYLREGYDDPALRGRCQELLSLALRTDPLSRDEPRASEVVSALANLDRLSPVESYLKSNPAILWPLETAQAVYASVLRTLSHGGPLEKATAARVLAAATSGGQLTRPNMAELLRFIDDAGNEPHASTLANMAFTGSLNGDYPREPLIGWLKTRVPEHVLDHHYETHSERLYRQSLISIAALAPGQLAVDELVELAFRPPVQADTVHRLTGILAPGPDGCVSWPIEDRVSLVILVGKRLAGPEVSNRARKDTAGRWRQPLFHLFTGLDAELTRSVLCELPTFDHWLAEVVAGRVTVYETPESRDLMRALAADERVTAETRRQLTFAQQRSTVDSAGWWTVYEDLDRAPWGGGL